MAQWFEGNQRRRWEADEAASGSGSGGGAEVMKGQGHAQQWENSNERNSSLCISHSLPLTSPNRSPISPLSLFRRALPASKPGSSAPICRLARHLAASTSRQPPPPAAAATAGGSARQPRPGRKCACSLEQLRRRAASTTPAPATPFLRAAASPDSEHRHAGLPCELRPPPPGPVSRSPNTITCERSTYDDYVKTHKKAAGLYGKSFSFYNDLNAIFTKDRALGDNRGECHIARLVPKLFWLETRGDCDCLKGVPCTTSHDIVGRSVALCIAKNCQLSDLTLGELQSLSLAFEGDVYEFLGVENNAKKFCSYMGQLGLEWWLSNSVHGYQSLASEHRIKNDISKMQQKYLVSLLSQH
ncbi:hypothetical protein J5N97_017761 [Dioscorea zingiberensis]|uniref:Argininosuccinate lyase C-terminal domain-containing protein n=1 Tax=Dioscorea zingiberensis TaxID=325984 RepID=A0A9D5HGI3_9LILI|nr:hypothetical protein J5N97_017761 [Dioscorea zingiberensis]